MLLAGSANSDWYLGLTLGFIIVTVVVILVAVILSYAARISDQTRLANEGLEDVRTGTAPLWEVRNTNKAGIAILGAARTAREAVVATITGAPLPAASPQAGMASPQADEAPVAPPSESAAAPPAAPEAQPQSGPAQPPGVLGPENHPNRGQGA